MEEEFREEEDGGWYVVDEDMVWLRIVRIKIRTENR